MMNIEPSCQFCVIRNKYLTTLHRTCEVVTYGDISNEVLRQVLSIDLFVTSYKCSIEGVCCILFLLLEAYLIKESMSVI